MEWKEIFTPPFREEYGMILDVKGRFCMNNLASDKNIQSILQKLNGKPGEKSKIVFKYNKKSCKVFGDDMPILWIRAWGRMTGIAGLNLSENEASKIQDDFGEWIVTTLNK
ncbi:MAG: hypothetical protein GY775_16630 [Candidatus Scalindua sp.]|nr:hypothetical protein [Candidatus Scalindua sp.]